VEQLLLLPTFYSLTVHYFDDYENYVVEHLYGGVDVVVVAVVLVLENGWNSVYAVVVAVDDVVNDDGLDLNC